LPLFRGAPRAEDRGDRDGKAVRATVNGDAACNRGFDLGQRGGRLGVNQRCRPHRPPAKSLEQISRRGNTPLAAYSPLFGFGKSGGVQ